MKKGMITPIAVCLLFLALSSCQTYVNTGTSTSGNSITVEALDDEISYNLDLRAVATLFADSRNTEDFERMLNDYDRGISNLDLNHDGYVDYLRVVETYENGTHLFLLQAALDYDVFQDVATIVVENNQDGVSVDIIGDPFIYGSSYIINPVFSRTPMIYSSFRTPGYTSWYSPYYWGYYPVYYHYRAPIRTNVYVTNVYNVVNVNNNYRYVNSISNRRTVDRMQSSLSRNDYARANPRQSFSSRNANVTNAREIQTRNANTRTTTSSSRSSSSLATRNSDNATNNSSSSRSGSSGTINSSNNNSSRSSSSGTVNSSNNNSSRSNSSGTNTNSSSRSSSSGTVNSNTNNSSRSSSSGTNTNSSSSSRSSSSGSSETNSRSSSGGRR
ncbi:MAG: hypothetical protein FWF53_08995 [Candidatus Azobacteroides sp.]|nr:hypothetical protein [Candidatus Azobacteroides sp.]